MASRFGMLQDLVVAIWRTEDIRAYARRHDLQGSLPEGVPLASLASEFVDLLQRRGMVDSELFDALAKTAPRRATEIAQVAEAWEVAWKAPAVKAAPMPPTAPEPPIQPVSNQGAPDVFIALGGSQRAAAVEVAELLRRRGWRVRLDADLTDQDWTTGLTDWIKTARAIVVLLPADWSTAKWLRHELPLIDERKQAAVSVQAFAEVVPSKPSESPPYTQAWTWRRWEPADAQATAEDVHEVLVGRLGVPEPTAQDPRPNLPSTVEAHRAALNQELRRAYGALAEVARHGGDQVPLRQEILRIKRALNEGPQLAAGMVLDHYELHEVIGSGGYATVWRAWDLERERDVAVKLLHHDRARDGSRLKRFFRGARQMANLDHPHVVRVLREHGEDRGFHFYVMELLPGGDLHAAVAHGRLHPHDAVRFALQAAEALVVAHARGVVHRDVKPHNILLSADGKAKLTDFDLVKAADTTGATRTGTLGSWLYVAPEAHATAEVDAKADVYGLAMTVVFCLQRKDPGVDAMYDRETWLVGLPVGEAVRAVLRRGLELEPGARPGMREFVEVLREAVRLDGVGAELAPVADGEEGRQAGGGVEARGPDGGEGEASQVVVPAATREIGPLGASAGESAVTPPEVVAVSEIAAAQNMVVRTAAARQSDPPVSTGGVGGVQVRPPKVVPPPEVREAAALDRAKGAGQGSSTVAVPAGAHDGGGVRAACMGPWIGLAGVVLLTALGWWSGGGSLDDGNSPGDRLAVPDAIAAVVSLLAEVSALGGGRLGEVAVPLVELPSGAFQMGSPEGVGDPDEHPRHAVTVSAFSIGLTEVTQAQWRSVVEAGKTVGIAEASGLDADPSSYEGATRPVENVSWCDVVRWLNVLSELRRQADDAVAPVYEVSSTCESGGAVTLRPGVRGYRLPTEAEWEYAARAGCSMDWCDPEGKPVELSEVGWFADAIDETHPVGEKLSNPWGLHDMAGNVGEWTGDWYASRHASSRSPSPTSGASGGERVHRGGSFGSAVSGCRFANRDKLTPDSRFANLGFRVVLSAASADGGH